MEYTHIHIYAAYMYALSYSIEVAICYISVCDSALDCSI
jgi:hypothetical protein